jgi:uncharacterized protein (TIGR02996 family)
MSAADEDTFVQAILDEPESDSPRLVYADWLEERSDPRAEFIRVQCALSHRKLHLRVRNGGSRSLPAPGSTANTLPGGQWSVQ